MSQPRAADDFATIRGRMEELRQSTRPRAADDFTTIRRRMEELRRERDQVLADQMDQTPSGPRQYHHRKNGDTEPQGDRLLPRIIRPSLLRVRSRQAADRTSGSK
jgi:hypothetical protein